MTDSEHRRRPDWLAPPLLIATCGWVGRIPFAPGTFGSLVGLPLSLATGAAATWLAGRLAAVLQFGWYVPRFRELRQLMRSGLAEESQSAPVDRRLRFEAGHAGGGISQPRRRPRVTVAGDTTATAEAVGDLVRVAGGEVVEQITGRPPIAADCDCIVWDRGARLDGDLGWLQLLAGQQPERPIILLCSFPRGDAVTAARAAGATAVLGRPADREALLGLLLTA